MDTQILRVCKKACRKGANLARGQVRILQVADADAAVEAFRHQIDVAVAVMRVELQERVLGGLERVHVMARKNFYQDYPKVAEFLTRMYLPLDELQAIML